MPADPLIVQSVALPIAIDLGATILFSITGAMEAIRRHYDSIGLFVLALACSAAVCCVMAFSFRPDRLWQCATGPT